MGREKSIFRESGRGIRLFVLALSGLALCVSSVGLAQNSPETPESGDQTTQSFQQLAEQAQAAQDADRIPEAIRLYERATALRPSWSEGWWYLGTMLFDSNQIVEAHDAFLHFVSVEHKQPGPGFGMLGLTEFELKDYPKALDAVERGRALGLGNNPAFVHRVLYVDGILNNDLGQPEIALVRLTLVANQVAQEHPEAPKDAVLGDAELLDAFGLAALRIQKLPTEIPAKQAALLRQAGHAQALIALQDRVAAGAEIKQLVVQNPSEPGVHYMSGVYLLKEDPPSAMEEFRREIAVSPRNPAARIQLALEFLRSSEYKQGLTYAQEAIALAPDNFVAHVACGKLWLGLENTDRALRELRTAVRLSPGSPDAHFALSRALSDAGQSREAAQERAEFERLKALSNAADRNE
jgi:tetratricopeptide (TPR) repeat protein